MKTALSLTAVVGMIIVILATWLYTPDEPLERLQKRYDTAGTSYVSIAGIRLRIEDTGPRTAPAIILLHGFGASLETWEPWASALAIDHRVIRFDLPGFGLTGPDPQGDYSDQRTMIILVALMDRLGLPRAALIGNSLGGRIAWRFAAQYPARVTRLVLVSPDGFASPGFAYGKPPAVPLTMRLLPYTLPRFLLRMNLAIAYAAPRRLTGCILNRYRDMMLAPGNRRAILARMRQTILTDPAPILHRIKAPTLILWGEDDRMIPFGNAADYMRDIPHATLAPLPGLGHVPFEEAPEESLRPVAAFLSE